VSRPTLQAFGLRLVTDVELPGRWRPPASLSDRVLEIALDPSVPRALEDATLEWAAPIDGGRFTLERGADGAVLFSHETGRHLLSPDFRALRCAPRDARDPAWFRVMLDTVLHCTALLGGQEALHAGSVTVGEGVIAIVAASGGGKSTLVTEMLRRGHGLVSDDITFLEAQAGGPPFAQPGVPVLTVADATEQPVGGEVLMDLPGERWVTAAVAAGPAPVRAVIKLDRRPGASTQIKRDPDALRVLLGAMLKLPRTPERELARLNLASILDAHCRILILTADLLATPVQLAELVEEAVLAQ
jgi:hypothetical protein